MSDPLHDEISRLIRRPDRERARKEAQRIVDEAPQLVQPSPTTVNLAACFLELLHRMEGLER